MVVVRIQGGLGNQLFQVAMGRSLKKRPHELVLYDLYHLDKARTAREDKTSLLGLGALSFKSPWILKCIKLVSRVLYRKRMKVLEERRFGYDPEIKRYEENDIYVFGYFQSWLYVEPQLAWIRSKISFRHVTKFLPKNLQDRISNPHSLVVHIRRGDYVSVAENTQFHGVCSQDYYEEAFRRIALKCPIDQAFIFSDDKDFGEFARSWFPVDSELVSVPNDKTDLAEFCLMSSGVNFVIANSTFSYWAALLSPSQRPLVVAPKKWFAQKDLVADSLFPPYWELV